MLYDSIYMKLKNKQHQSVALQVNIVIILRRKVCNWSIEQKGLPGTLIMFCFSSWVLVPQVCPLYENSLFYVFVNLWLVHFSAYTFYFNKTFTLQNENT